MNTSARVTSNGMSNLTRCLRQTCLTGRALGPQRAPRHRRLLSSEHPTPTTPPPNPSRTTPTPTSPLPRSPKPLPTTRTPEASDVQPPAPGPTPTDEDFPQVRASGRSSRSFPEFVPRATFGDHHNIVTSFFLGHHKAGLDKMSAAMNNVDLVLECRDYRVPLSSRNPLFESTLQGKPRIIVYTKRDLGGLSSPVRDIITRWHAPHPVLFTTFNYKRDILQVIAKIRAVATEVDKLTGCRCLVVGMPNVGKSTLLNSLRLHGDPTKLTKAARTGKQPGITRALSTTIRISDEPLVYCVDTPGVFVPYLPHAETMLKLALVGSVKDSLVPATTVADYLLYVLNRKGYTTYMNWFPPRERQPTNDVNVLLEKIARRIGKFKRGKELDIDSAAVFFVNKYRDGSLGKFLLDDVQEMGLQKRVEEEGEWGESLNAGRKRLRAERAEKSKARAIKGGIIVG